MFSIQESHLHSGDGGELKKTVITKSDVVLLATVWWPHHRATQHSSSPCCMCTTHIHSETHTHRERKALSSSFTSPAASAAPAYTHNLGHVQGRHNTSHHSSTLAKFRTGPMCSHKPREMHFCKQKRTPTLQYWTKNNNPPSKSLNHKKPRSYSDTFRPWELIVTAIWELEKERTREDLIPGF